MGLNKFNDGLNIINNQLNNLNNGIKEYSEYREKTRSLRLTLSFLENMLIYDKSFKDSMKKLEKLKLDCKDLISKNPSLRDLFSVNDYVDDLKKEKITFESEYFCEYEVGLITKEQENQIKNDIIEIKGKLNKLKESYHHKI